jgi:hypothetical protein
MSLWIDEPTSLFQKDNILELWPFDNMNYNAKINAITRIIIVLTFVGYIMTESMYIIIICLIALAVIYKMASIHKSKTESKPKYQIPPPPLHTTVAPDNKNPYNNVLLTDIGKDEKNKKDINNIQPENNDGQKDLWEVEQDKYLDHIFYSTASTEVVNDREGFTKFLYGNMPSSKEDGSESASMRVKRNERYRLY